MSAARSDIRQHLDRILAEEARLLSELQAVLQSETAIVSGEDADAIARIGNNRQHCVERLSRLGQERSDTSRMLSFGADATGLDRMFEWADPTRALRGRWSSNLSLARLCKALNDKNGAIVIAKLDRVQQLLQKLRGVSAPVVYGTRASRYASLGTRDLGCA